MKKLKPALPKDMKQLAELGFGGNISGSAKFVTDGHTLLLASALPKEMAFKKSEDGPRKPVGEVSMQACLNTAASRKQQPLEFIGCAVAGRDIENKPVVVAVVRGKGGLCAGINPYKLKFALSATGADCLLGSADSAWRSNPIILHRGDGVVGMVMPMRLDNQDFEAYNLTGPAMPLSEVYDAISKKS